MKRGIHNVLIGSIFAACGALTLSAAAGASENDAAQLPEAKVTLAHAVAAAEQKIGGRAVKAELESTRHGLAYDVEVVGPKGIVYDVAVDAQTGKVLSSEVDKDDDDDRDDKAD